MTDSWCLFEKNIFRCCFKREKRGKKPIQNPHVCALCLCCTVYTFSTLGACRYRVVHKRRCVTGAFALMCHQSAELETVPTCPGSLNSPTHMQGSDNSLRNWSCGASIKLSITQLVYREVWRKKGRQLSCSLRLVSSLYIKRSKKSRLSTYLDFWKTEPTIAQHRTVLAWAIEAP